MTREWKPGDVAMVPQLGGAERMAIVGTYGRPAVLAPPHFVYADGGYDDVRGKGHEARPLVVIDPEDREQVEQLVELILAHGYDFSGKRVSDLAQALREFANPTPPKPDEPTGLGAVVEAIYDNRFIHVGNGRWFRLGDPDRLLCKYGEIAAVRVLSEGVEVDR